MDDGLARWLGLREPHDWSARSARLVDAVRRALPQSGVLRVLDLGTGTGSNLRYLIPRLGARQEWLLVDKSPDVLRSLTRRTAAWAEGRGLRLTVRDDGFSITGAAVDCIVQTTQRDLDLPLPPDMFAGRHLVTASALVDLASDAWLSALADRCRAEGCAALLALTYNGRSGFDPPVDGDDLARDLLNVHQRRNKGLGGPAAGPHAHTAAMNAFQRAGFAVEDAETNWQVAAEFADFQRLFIDGLAGAAVEERTDAASIITAWQQQRLELLERRRSHVVVGHYDLAAWPTAI